MLVFWGVRHFMVVFLDSDVSWMMTLIDFNDRIWLFFSPFNGCTHTRDKLIRHLVGPPCCHLAMNTRKNHASPDAFFAHTFSSSANK